MVFLKSSLDLCLELSPQEDCQRIYGAPSHMSAHDANIVVAVGLYTVLLVAGVVIYGLYRQYRNRRSELSDKLSGARR